MFKFIDIILLKFFPKFYLGLTRAQDSNDRFIFGSDFIKINKKNNNISVLDVGCGGGNFFSYVNSVAKNSKYLGDNTLSLPLYPNLKTKDVNYICETIQKFFKS